MATIFYTQCGAGELIDKRKAIYNQETRDSDSYLWLYKKMAAATASAGGITLGTVTGAGFPSRTNKNSVYTTTNTSPGNNVRNLIPKPHLVSIKTSYAGDFGSVQKCEIAFTVYSLDQLNECQGFFTINAPVYAKWGWTNAGSAGGNPVSFSGNVVNFSWSINSTGGAECTCSAIGKGVNTLSINANLSSKDQSKKYKSGEIELPVTSILEKLKYYIQEGQSTIPGTGGLGFQGFVKAPLVYKKPDPDPPANPPVENNETTTNIYYVSLGLIVYEFNQSLAAYTSTHTQLKIDAANGGLCQIPNSTSWASANPSQCIFPGMSKYGKGIDDAAQSLELENDVLANTYTAGGIQNIGYIMIEIDYLNEVMKSLGDSTDKGERSPSKTINDFFKKLFTMIDSNSGGAIKLSTVMNPKKTTEILIIETQFIPKGITAKEIPAVTQKSITRSMSLTAKVPSELQVVASVSANSGAGNVNSTALKPFTGANKIISDVQTQEQKDAAAAAAKIDQDLAVDLIALEKQQVESLEFLLKSQQQALANSGPQTFGQTVRNFFGGDDEFYKEEKEKFSFDIQQTQNQIAELKNKISSNILSLDSPLVTVYLLGPKPEYVSAARSYLRTILKPKSTSIVYPLDFSFTIDGIAGIKFGDAVTTNYMPAIYKQKPTRCSFTVLSVEHNVSGNDWTTTCSTVFRMRPS